MFYILGPLDADEFAKPPPATVDSNMTDSQPAMN